MDKMLFVRKGTSGRWRVERPHAIKALAVRDTFEEALDLAKDFAKRRGLLIMVEFDENYMGCKIGNC